MEERGASLIVQLHKAKDFGTSGVRHSPDNFIHEIGGVPGTELFQQIGSMEIDRTWADAECPCSLLGGAPYDLSQRNTFSGSQSLMSGEWFRQDVQCTI